MLALGNLVNVHLAQKVLHAIVDLLVCQPLQHPAEHFEAGGLVAIVVDEMLVVLPQVLLRSVACLYRFDDVLSCYRGRDYRRADASGVKRLGHPRRVADQHVAVCDKAVVLPPD